MSSAPPQRNWGSPYTRHSSGKLHSRPLSLAPVSLWSRTNTASAIIYGRQWIVRASKPQPSPPLPSTLDLVRASSRPFPATCCDRQGWEHSQRDEPVASDCCYTCHMSAMETGATAPVTNIASRLLSRQLCSHSKTHNSTPRVSDSASTILHLTDRTPTGAASIDLAGCLLPLHASSESMVSADGARTRRVALVVDLPLSPLPSHDWSPTPFPHHLVPGQLIMGHLCQSTEKAAASTSSAVPAHCNTGTE